MRFELKAAGAIVAAIVAYGAIWCLSVYLLISFVTWCLRHLGVLH